MVGCRCRNYTYKIIYSTLLLFSGIVIDIIPKTMYSKLVLVVGVVIDVINKTNNFILVLAVIEFIKVTLRGYVKEFSCTSG